MQGVDDAGGACDCDHRQVVNRLFANLHGRWFPPPPDLGKNFLESAQGYLEIEKALRTDPNLRRLSHSLFSEILSPPDAPGAEPTTAVQLQAEIHLVCQMVQVMEDAWLSLDLQGYFAHPMNRGWMNTFRRWTSSRVFASYWPLIRGQFSKDFVRFCETELRLAPGQLLVERLSRASESQLLADSGGEDTDPVLRHQWNAVESIQNEFSREWPS